MNMCKAGIKKLRKSSRNFLSHLFPPTLFFSSDGIVVHKAVGFKQVNQFIAEAKKSLNPDTQFYTTVSKFKRGELDTAQLKNLALEYREVDAKLAGDLAAQYLSKLPKSQLNTPEVLFIVSDFRSHQVVEDVILNYLKRLNKQNLANKLKLLTVFKDVGRAKKIADAYIKQLSIQELYTVENLILLSNFN